MDKIDFCILSELMKDAQTPFSRIAEKLGVSPETVRKRYEKMIKGRQILNCTIEIDLSKLGYQTIAFFFIKNAPNHDNAEIVDLLQKIPNVFIIVEITGEFNVMANAAIRNLKDLATFMNKIFVTPAIDRVEFILSNELFFPLPNIKYQESAFKIKTGQASDNAQDR